MNKYAALLAGLVLAACHAMTIPADAATTPVYSYNLLRGNAGGDTVSPVAGDYQVILGGTYNGATLTLYQTVNSLITTIGTYTSTPGTTPCITIPSGANMQMTVTGGPPSGMTAVLGGVGVGGCGGGGSSGTVTEIDTGAGLSGGPITTTGTISISEALGNSGSAITGTTYSVSPTNDAAKQLLFTGSSASAWDAAGTGSVAAGLGFDIVNAGTANVTFTPAAGIDGGASLVIPFGSWAHIFYDGSTFRSEPGKNLSGVTAGTYGDATHCVSVTVDKFGRLTAASQSTSCPGGASSNSNWVAGNWYNVANSGAANGTAVSATVTEWVPVYFDKPVTIGNIGGRITTADASGNMQFAIYAASSSTGLPTGSALCTTASISQASTGSFDGACNATGSSALSSAGRYWFGYQTSSATAAIMAQNAAAINSVIGANSHANLSGSSTAPLTEYKTTGGTFGTWPTNPTISYLGVSAGPVPMVQFSISSVP